MNQFNNSVTFRRKTTGSEEFLNQMIESLGIIIYRRPKGIPRKMENYSTEKIGCVPIKKLKGKMKSDIARLDPIIFFKKEGFF